MNREMLKERERESESRRERAIGLLTLDNVESRQSGKANDEIERKSNNGTRQK